MTHANPHNITVDEIGETVRIEVDGAVVAESSRARACCARERSSRGTTSRAKT